MTFGGLRFEKEDLMKKLLAVCAAAVLLLSLAACGKTDTDTITDSKADKPAAETAGVGTHWTATPPPLPCRTLWIWPMMGFTMA